MNCHKRFSRLGSSLGLSTAGKAIAASVVIIIAAIAGYVYIQSLRPSQPVVTISPSPAKLGVSDFSPLIIFANGTTPLSVTLTNSGGDATNIVITLNSNAFDQASSSIQTAPSGSHTGVTIIVRPVDTTDGIYPVSISVSYADSDGTSQTRDLGTHNIVLGPNVKFTGVGWLWPTGSLSAKSTIGHNDNTESRVTLQSLSTNAQYSGITVNETFSGDHAGLTITPQGQSAGLIGSKGPSQELKFQITSVNAPTGQYIVAIVVYEHGVLVERTTVVLTVS